MSKEFISKPCPNCPFRRDVRPYLTVERAEDLAFNASNPYGTFVCHETTVSDDDSEDGEMLIVETSKICAGHLSLQHHCNGDTYYSDEGFEPSPLCYEEPYEMVEAYELETEGDWESPL